MTNFESLGNFMSKQDNMPGQAWPVKGHIDFIEFFTYLLNTLYKNA